tara:strand:- start:16009 stop:16395 length:387 start_codon:yes stop_codon:yes gene_type:complete
MGIEDDFYATIKLKCGEEIFAKVAASDEDDRTMLLISNPIMIEPVKSRGSVTGYKFEPWLKTSHEDLFIINLDDVLTMSESENLEMIMNYQEYIRKSTKGNFQKLDRKMGYISSVHDAKEVLEKLYNL